MYRFTESLLYYKSKIEFMWQDRFFVIKLHVIGCLLKLKLRTFPNKSATMFSYYIPYLGRIPQIAEWAPTSNRSKSSGWLLHTSGSSFESLESLSAICDLSSGARAIKRVVAANTVRSCGKEDLTWLGLWHNSGNRGNNVTAAYKRDYLSGIIKDEDDPRFGWQWERLAI